MLRVFRPEAGKDHQVFDRATGSSTFAMFFSEMKQENVASHQTYDRRMTGSFSTTRKRSSNPFSLEIVVELK